MPEVRARVTCKWQITVPLRVREALGLQVGDVLEFVQAADGAWLIRRQVPAEPFDRYVGFLHELAGPDPDELLRELRGR